jgi:hypothetical protein
VSDGEHPAQAWIRQTADSHRQRIAAALRAAGDEPERPATSDEWIDAIVGIVAAPSFEELLTELVDHQAQLAPDLETRLALLAIDPDELRARAIARLAANR